ncbi:MAG: hypothetical protein P9L99_07115 [Candidatus Lernaella stagnicola]|nr:hypothetical protein [Candidatus Lernaella stagnicola]
MSAIRKRDVWWMIGLALLLVTFVALFAACGDDNDAGDDDNDAGDDDRDPAEADTLIITSDYGNRYNIFDGTTYEHLLTVEPLVEDMNGVLDATIISLADQHFSVFASDTTETAHPQIYAADAFSGDGVLQLTSIDRPGIGDIIPYGNGIMFIGTPAGTTSVVLTMDIESAGSPSEYRGASFRKAVDIYDCATTKWESPDFSAAGWHCWDNEAPDTAQFVTVIAIEDGDDSEDCGEILWRRELEDPSISDLCFINDGTMVVFSVGHESEDKQIFVAPVDTEDSAVEITSSFNNGHVQNFDCDPTSSRIVYSEMEVNPNIYVLEYEIGDDRITISSDVTQITEDGEFRRPRWVKN